MGKIIIPSSDSFFLAFGEFSNDPKLETARKKLRDRKYTAGQLGISYRVISHWAECGLLPEGLSQADGEWKKLTVVEIVWVRVVKRLRNFGFSLRKIIKVKEGIMDWEQKTETYPLFEFYVGLAWFNSSDPYIASNSDGDAVLATYQELNNAKIINGETDMILISLKSVLREMGIRVAESSGGLGLSHTEIDLLDEIASGKADEISLKIDKEEAKIKELEIKNIYRDRKEFLKDQSLLKKEGWYGGAEEKVEKGEFRSAIIKRKKKY